MEKKKGAALKARRRTLTPRKAKPAKGSNSADKAIHEGWHKVDGTPIDDLEGYIYKYLADHSKEFTIEIAIGTDGRSTGGGKNLEGVRTSEVKLMTVVCFKRIGRGAHIIKRREATVYPWVIKTGEKLNMEVQKTYELAVYLQEKGIKFDVHLDLNPNKDHDSFNVYNTIKGFFEGLGFKTEYKPESAAATSGADYFLG